MKTSESFDARVDYFAGVADRARTLPFTDKHPIPCDAIVRAACAGMLNSRTGKLLSKSRSFEANPLGNLLRCALDFHASTGSLWGPMLGADRARFLSHQPKEGADTESEFERQRALVLAESLTGTQLWDQLDTLALVIRGGKSPAAENWRRALHGGER